MACYFPSYPNRVLRFFFFLLLLALAGCQTPVSDPPEGDEPTQPDEEAVEPDQTEEEGDDAELPLDERYALGWVEWICLDPEGVRMKAKLDTGALTSSMNAMNLERFERDGDRWVRFEIIDPATEERVLLERPIARNVRIVRHEDDPDRRPVVELEVRLGDIHQKAEFTLADRSNFVYQVLIGRRFLRGLALVDSEQTFISGRPPCGDLPGTVDPDDAQTDEDARDDGR